MLALTKGDTITIEWLRVWVIPIRSVFLTSLLVFALGISPSHGSSFSVVRIYDGDTLTISSGERVRLLQIDTPEISSGECFASEAQKLLASMIGQTSISMERDSASDDRDKFGRILRYVKVGKLNVNLRLVEIGAATPYFYQGEKGKYSRQLLKAAENAKVKKIGLWKLCPNTKLDPSKPVTTGSAIASKAATSTTSSNANCDPNYQGCIPPYPPDLDCTDIKRMGLAPIRVIGRDLHKFDGDGYGIGCDK